LSGQEQIRPARGKRNLGLETFIILSLIALAFILAGSAWMKKRKQDSRDKGPDN
jgi:hypothetical protein